jgi:diguanylate cyclase (GGDEF)-like protein
VILDEFSTDPCTGLSNFFGFLEMCSNSFFGAAGAIAIVEISGLMNIKAVRGLKGAEDCIRALAGALRSKVTAATQNGKRKNTAFRYGGDEFIMILPGFSYGDAEREMERITAAFQENLKNQQLNGIKLHVTIVEYCDPEARAATLIKAVYMALNRRYREVGPSALPAWADEMMDGLAERINRTLVLLREARTMALTDDISGLPNHRAAELYLEDLMRKHQNSGLPFSVLLVDGDQLKAYNEISYEKGNEVIRLMGTLLARAVRHGDKVIRWLSGDEFMVLLPGADRKAALQVAERLRSNMADETAKMEIPVTVSIGVASCPEDAVELPELIKVAEEANIQAKRMGKNQVV